MIGLAWISLLHKSSNQCPIQPYPPRQKHSMRFLELKKSYSCTLSGNRSTQYTLYSLMRTSTTITTAYGSVPPRVIHAVLQRLLTVCWLFVLSTLAHSCMMILEVSRITPSPALVILITFVAKPC